MGFLSHLADWPAAAIAAVLGYLLGSLPFGLILTHVAGMQDIRAIGSGNIGATNVLRTGRRGLAAATLVCDMLKGTLAVVIARHLFGQEMSLIAGLAAFLGHLFPLWLKFKGGKGVATYIGVLLAAAWPVALGYCAIWLAVAGLTRYSSLSALIATAATPVILWLGGYLQEAQLFLILSIIIFITHRANIGRLIAGTESRIGQPTVPPRVPQ